MKKLLIVFDGCAAFTLALAIGAMRVGLIGIDAALVAVFLCGVVFFGSTITLFALEDKEAEDFYRKQRRPQEPVSLSDFDMELTNLKRVI